MRKKVEKPNSSEDKGTQLCLVDLGISKVSDDLTSLMTTPAMFVAGGSLVDRAWVELMITDILSSKLRADYLNSRDR